MAKVERESGDAAISLIAPGMAIVGDCETDGTIRVEGRIEGTIRAGKSVVVGRSGEVIGDIITQDAVISGRVTGNVAADSRLELQSTCDIQGELRSRRVQLDEGARFNGQVHMEEAGGSRVVKPAEKPVGQEVKDQAARPAAGGD
ncbi:MAG: polymer-forming cytoskeletal protein [Gemmatimonadota bacterium]|nr:MAG: polymer-forming cytoskeletal protein [Gemmatimonadota bacterium]